MTRKKKKKKRKLKIKNILIFLLVLICFCGLICLIILMPVRNIYINGNNVISDEVIIEQSGLDKYPSFLLTSSNKVKNSLRNNKYISDVKIKKKLGNIIEIKVLEHRLISFLANDTKIILSNGNVVDNIYNVSDLPVLNSNLSDRKKIEFAKKFNKVDKDILRQISQIEYVPVKVDEERFLLYMDDGNLVYVTLTKINKLNKYNKIKGKLVGKMGVVYLDSGDYVELKDNKSVVNNNDKKVQ